jgi:hypothetical protein
MITINLPNLHDGTIDMLSLKANNVLEIGLTDVKNVRYRLVLSGLERLRCQDFREGNIILDVSLVNGQSPDKDALRELFGLTNDQTPHFLAQIIVKIEQGLLAFVNITPSYGCEVLALCSNVCLENV